MKKIKFYDTSSLLLKADTLFEAQEVFAISSITLNELENIKSSIHKDIDIKYTARKLINKLDEHVGEYQVVFYTDDFLTPLLERGIDEINNDTKILGCGFSLKISGIQDVEFVTNDICLKHLAMLLFSNVTSVQEVEDNYFGYKCLTLTEDEILKFYSNQNDNSFDLLINQYGIFYNENKEIIDIRRWDGKTYQFLDAKPINSKQLGSFQPYDIYQKMALDSMRNNQLTVVRGPAGGGKSLASLIFLFNQLEQGKIDKIIIFCNTVATAGAAKLGYLPGTREEKLLDSQIGNFLTSKLGGRCEVERLIKNEELLLLPMSDIRGYDTSGMRAGIYITECQNMSISMLKLALQRIGEDSICILDGDNKTQVDMKEYAGKNNGMTRMSQVFRGQEFYGEVELKNIYRSKIAKIAEKM